MKNIKSTLLFAVLLTLVNPVAAMEAEPLSDGGSQGRDYYIQKMEDERSRLMITQNVRSVLVQATLNCLNRKLSEANTERIDIVLDLCFKMAKTIASGHTRQLDENFVNEMKGTLIIDDIRQGRQDIMKTIVCVRDNTRDIFRGQRSEEVAIMKSDMSVLEKCGFDPILMGTRVLPNRAEQQNIGNGLNRFIPY